MIEFCFHVYLCKLIEWWTIGHVSTSRCFLVARFHVYTRACVFACASMLTCWPVRLCIVKFRSSCSRWRCIWLTPRLLGSANSSFLWLAMRWQLTSRNCAVTGLYATRRRLFSVGQRRHFCHLSDRDEHSLFLFACVGASITHIQKHQFSHQWTGTVPLYRT